MAMMFYLLNAYYEIERIIDTYKSAIWTERYEKSGDFELFLPATADLIDAFELVQNPNELYICRADDTTKVGIVERVEITTDVEQGNFIIVSGRTMQSILFRRIVILQTTYTGSPKQIIEKLIINNFTNPTSNDRKVNVLTLGTSPAISTDSLIVSAQYDGDNVGEEIEKLCNNYHIGYKIAFDIENKNFTFSIYEGTDRSTDQNENPFVIFSNDFNNLLSSSFAVDRANKKTLAWVFGEGEGTKRVKYPAQSQLGTGLYRFELKVNDIQSSTNGGEITSETYENALWLSGINALKEHRTKISTEGNVAPNYGFVLNRDYFLGDVVTVKNEYGIETTPRVVEVIEAQDDTGYSCIPTFRND